MNCARDGWTDSLDDTASCTPTTVHVNGGEEICRLLHSKNFGNPKEWLKRDELFGKKGASPVNVCNDPKGSSGASLVRVNGLSEAAIRQRAKAHAETKDDRESRGAVAGGTADLRAIRSKKKPDAQVVFVYDDPIQGDDRHCIVRVDQASRTEGDYLRTEILKVLARRIAE